MVSKGYVDPASATYTSDNVAPSGEEVRHGLQHGRSGGERRRGRGEEPGGHQPTQLALGEEGRPLLPEQHHDLQEQQSEHPGSHAFLTYYYQNMAPLWTENTGIGLPPPFDQQDPGVSSRQEQGSIIEEWQPISKTWAAPGGEANFLNVTTVDATPAMNVSPVDPRRINRRDVGLDEASG